MTTPGLTTRPITDRVKESLFENIQQRITGSRVADVFSGTGTIGLEALSRGAGKITFIEKDRQALALLRQNIATLGCNSDTLVWPADVLRCSFRPKGEQAEVCTPFDVVFFDPPYKMVPGIQPGRPLWLALVRLSRRDVTSPESTLVLRTPERSSFALPEEWSIDWTLTLSNMQVHVCSKRPSPVADQMDHS